MEQLNAKLYSKYQNLKKRKGFEEEEWFQKLESDLRKSKLATEDMIENLKNENNRLRAQMSSIQDQYDECQKLLFEERQKTRGISNEIGRLQELLSQRNHHNDAALPLSPHTSPAVISRHLSGDSPGKTVARALPFGSPATRSGGAHNSSLTKKRRSSSPEQIDLHCKEAATLYNNNTKEPVVPDCCRGNLIHSTSKGYHSCVFQAFLEQIVGMEFSVSSQGQGLSLSVIHPMSGYTFSLSWIADEDGSEGDLMYRVSSLGTLERVALEWMKEDIIFSMRMCPVFFEKISRVIGHHR
ncbi:uncharacterized protein LOC120273420 [Dioscorea cayenensis subsp. rotundata]|uniref:Uncharacterized protein LOC120273420 n=1 Tax=Dioscorea cayennensis subsp. rotundata TaxID=55577 RepID=A0AB40C9D3_DIOCR|nr:uncharacterized protein LOC120273420 [Dioscorea cayenensis subsp. rotundata]